MSSWKMIAIKASCLEPCEPNVAKRHYEGSPPVQSATNQQLCNSAPSLNVHAHLFLKQHVLTTFAETILGLKLEHHLVQLGANGAHLVESKLMVPTAAQSDLQLSAAASPEVFAKDLLAASFLKTKSQLLWSPKSLIPAKVQGLGRLPLTPKHKAKRHRSSLGCEIV